jgi:hypothetical protein
MTDHTTTPSASDSGLNLDPLEALQRFGWKEAYIGDTPELIEDPKGTYVLFTDVVELARRAAPVSAPIAGGIRTWQQRLHLREDFPAPAGDKICVAMDAEIKALRAALANQPASTAAPEQVAQVADEPAAAIGKDGKPTYWLSHFAVKPWSDRFEPLYRRAVISQPSEAAPLDRAGWKWVPVEPSHVMVGAGARAQLNADADGQANSLAMARAAYAAMLAAAPSLPAAAPAPTVPAGDALAEMEKRKDDAYYERNQVVAALAKCFPSGVTRTAIKGWSEDWHGCVYIDLPTGQASWHFHDSHAHLFAGLPPYAGEWDGHDTPEKYHRLACLAHQPAQEQAEPFGYFIVEGDDLPYPGSGFVRKLVEGGRYASVTPLYAASPVVRAQSEESAPLLRRFHWSKRGMEQDQHGYYIAYSDRQGPAWIIQPMSFTTMAAPDNLGDVAALESMKVEVMPVEWAHAEADAKDAERYRFLRKGFGDFGPDVDLHNAFVDGDEKMDAAIDAAIRAAQEGGAA